MGRMADTVLKKSNAAEKELEKRVIQYAAEKDKKAADREQAKIDAARKRDILIKETLDQQMQEKRDMKERELAKNKQFVQMVIDQDEKANKDKKEKQK